ncbi:MAG: hypothetical protein AB1428_02365 [Bacteroidota bacterium]
MRTAILVLKLAVLAYCSYLLVFLLDRYDPSVPGYSPPFVLWLLDTINLFIHEAGHLFFKLFGQWLYLLGGSLVQVLIPLALLIVVWRQNLDQIWYPGFWLGENLVNVSVYIKDAPYRKLRLLARGLIHDWNWLLNGDQETSEILGATVYWMGILICAAAIGAGAWFAVKKMREERDERRENAVKSGEL